MTRITLGAAVAIGAGWARRSQWVPTRRSGSGSELAPVCWSLLCCRNAASPAA
jgi:hypothetical protein